MAGGARSYRLPGVAAGSGAGHAGHRRHSGWPGTGRARSRRPVRIPPADLALCEGIQRDRSRQNARRARERLSPQCKARVNDLCHQRLLEDEQGNLQVHQLCALLPQLSLERLIIGDGS
jgi:hypothetical protein